jgi:NAD(P)-dependent dehydrogenase (short-subunit alcohol dehydrogenase family)
MFTLKGRTAVFTGNDPDVTRALLEGGMNVALATHNMERTLKNIELMGELGKNCMAVTCEADDPADTERAYKEIYDRFGSLDVIIPNHTGAPKQKSVEEYTLEEIDNIFSVVVGGSFNMVKTALPYLEKSTAPRVIFMSTPAALQGDADESLSNATARGGIVSLTFNLAKRLADKGITVNCIAKGGFAKGHPGHPVTDEMVKEVACKVPLHCAGNGDNFAAAVCFLASEEAGFVTGEVLNLSGGIHVG